MSNIEQSCNCVQQTTKLQKSITKLIDKYAGTIPTNIISHELITFAVNIAMRVAPNETTAIKACFSSLYTGISEYEQLIEIEAQNE